MTVNWLINGRWTLVEVPENFFSDWVPEEEDERPRRRPVYKTFVIRRPGPPDPRAVEAVLDWLNSGCSSG